MNKSLLFTLCLATATAGMAQDQDAQRERGEARTGSRILDRMEVVFDTAPIRLTAMATAAGVPAAPPHTQAQGRSITFVLDERLDIAADVFRHHPGFATDAVITGLESLDAVRRYLANAGSEPFRIINLVAHGSPQTGLSVAVEEDGAPASAAQLGIAVPVDDWSGSVDTDTELRVYGCGVGADPALLAGLARYFSDAAGRGPKVVALKEFVEFSAHPELNVALREGLTAVAPSRMAARRLIERRAAAQELSLPFRWERDFATKPLLIELEVGTANGSARKLAQSAPPVLAELQRLSVGLDDFRWSLDDGMLTGHAVLGYVALQPTELRAVLSGPTEADWIASR